MLYAVTGIAGAAYLVDGPSATGKAVALTAALISWILYGVLWLVRLLPRAAPLPSWVGARFGWLDAAFLVTTVVGVAVYKW